MRYMLSILGIALLLTMIPRASGEWDVVDIGWEPKELTNGDTFNITLVVEYNGTEDFIYSEVSCLIPGGDHVTTSNMDLLERDGDIWTYVLEHEIEEDHRSPLKVYLWTGSWDEEDGNLSERFKIGFEDGYEEDDDGGDAPGFEAALVACAVVSVVSLRRRELRRF